MRIRAYRHHSDKSVDRHLFDRPVWAILGGGGGGVLHVGRDGKEGGLREGHRAHTSSPPINDTHSHCGDVRHRLLYSIRMCVCVCVCRWWSDTDMQVVARQDCIHMLHAPKCRKANLDTHTLREYREREHDESCGAEWVYMMVSRVYRIFCVRCVWFGASRYVRRENHPRDWREMRYATRSWCALMCTYL